MLKLKSSACRSRERCHTFLGLPGLGIVARWGIIIVGLTVLSFAQDYLTSTGTPPFSAPERVEYGFVDASNGNLHIEIPMGSYPQRGSGKPEMIRFTYDANKLWTIVTSGGVSYWANDLWGGWGNRFSGPQPLTGDLTYVGSEGSGSCQGADYIYTDQSGTQHAFPPIVAYPTGWGCATTGDAFATDSSGLHLYVNGNGPGGITATNVYAPDGTMLYAYPASKDASGRFVLLEDSNGNYLSGDNSGGLAGTYTDTLGRSLSIGGTDGVTHTYSLPNSQGSTSNYTITWTTITVKTAFRQSNVQECAVSGCKPSVVQSITLPDNTSFSFKYDCDSTTGNTACGSPGSQSAYYGNLIGMTLPSGGTVTYSWTTFTDSYGNDHRWLASRTSGGHTWSYWPSIISKCSQTQVGCQQQVTTWRPTGDQVIYTFTLDNGAWPVQMQRYDTTLGLLSTTNTTWDFSHSCPWQGCYGHSYITRQSESETVPVPNGNITKKTNYTYMTYQSGLLYEIQEWGFYSGTFPTTADRTTYINYLTTGTNNINRPTSVTIYNGSNTMVAQTLTTHDQYGSNSLTSIPGICNHDDANFGGGNTARGNATSVKQWVSGSTYLTTSLTYDTTGQVTSVTGPTQANPTYYGYADNFFNDANPAAAYTPPVPTNAYLTKITLPGIANPVRYGYYYGTGQQAVETDPNLQSTNSHYLDAFSRPTANVYPIGWDLTTYPSSTEIDTSKRSPTHLRPPVAPVADTTSTCTMDLDASFPQDWRMHPRDRLRSTMFTTQSSAFNNRATRIRELLTLITFLKHSVTTPLIGPPRRHIPTVSPYGHFSGYRCHLTEGWGHSRDPRPLTVTANQF